VDKSVDGVDNLPESSAVLGIFAKDPIAGEVKTRLTPPLSAGQAVELYRSSLSETVANMAGGCFDLVICYAGGEAFFREEFPGTERQEQTGEDLGIRMSNALRKLFQRGYQKAVLIGSDSPDLPLSLVEQAFVALDEEPLVVAPALDGGYVLIGEAVHYPQLFEDIPWSSADVLAITRQRAEADGIPYRLLQEWDDLDDLAALRRFLQRSPDSRTAAYLHGLAELEDVFAQC
jgi:rSAM/selenodomain-associated transferase 1